MNNVQFFDFHGHDVRVMARDNEPWFVFADVRKIVGLAQQSLEMNLDDDEKGREIVSTPGGPQEMIVISESGLYTLPGWLQRRTGQTNIIPYRGREA